LQDLTPISEEGALPMENELTLTAFIATLGCRLRIGYYWSAQSEDGMRVIFTIWDDQLEDDMYLLWPSGEELPDWTKLPGAHEWQRHINVGRNDGVEILGIVCHAADPRAHRRVREYYDEAMLLSLKIIERETGLYAKVVGEVGVDRARQGCTEGYVRPQPSAISDFGDMPPQGIEIPERIPGNTATFRRNAMIRQYVLRRAQGRCELCGKAGFEMRDGSAYLETHHIIALAANGPDSVDNVIALCAEHHREAHFGANAEALNTKMLCIVGKH